MATHTFNQTFSITAPTNTIGFTHARYGSQDRSESVYFAYGDGDGNIHIRNVSDWSLHSDSPASGGSAVIDDLDWADHNPWHLEWVQGGVYYRGAEDSTPAWSYLQVHDPAVDLILIACQDNQAGQKLTMTKANDSDTGTTYFYYDESVDETITTSRDWTLSLKARFVSEDPTRFYEAGRD